MTDLAYEPGITVRPIGGLGNQLFIYATGLALATRLDCPLYMDVSWFESQELRSFDLGAMDHGARIVPPRPTESRTRRYASRARRAVRTGSLGVGASPNFYEEAFRYDPRILHVRPGTQLHGYFQSWRYFQDIHELISLRVRSAQPATGWFSETQSVLQALGAWTLVHVRRGDYLDPVTREYHGLAETTYYRRALSLVEGQLGVTPLVVFSDDPAAAAEVLRPLERDLHILEAPHDSSSMESLLLMSGCSSAVTANSSFSWWGAWLSTTNRLTVVPRPWFDSPGVVESDLIPPEWISVGR